MTDLSTKYLGLELKNPIIVGSSGLTDSVEKLQELEEAGAGAVVLKSLFEEEIIMEMEESKHHMGSRFFTYPETFDYMDEMPEEDSVRKYLRLIREAKEVLSIPVIASINCVSSQKWTYFAREIEKAGADALELNAFVLPSDFSRTTNDNEKIYFEIIDEIKSLISIPFSLKISYYFSNLGPFIQKLSETEVSGITLFNRFYSPDFDLDTLELTSGHVLSNPSDIAISLRWVGIMADRVSCDLSASTGVHNAKGVIKQLLAGATTVQVTSALYKNCNVVLKGMINELKDWMEEKEFASVDDFRGKLSQSKANDPAAYERVQFMKHFRHFIKA